jgi:hypothetical protein
MKIETETGKKMFESILAPFKNEAVKNKSQCFQEQNENEMKTGFDINLYVILYQIILL